MPRGGVRRYWRRLPAGSALLSGLLFAPLPAPGQESAPEPGGSEPRVELEDLLRLPDSVRYDVDKRGGATRAEWRERFQGLREDLDEERKALERARLELEKVAGNTDTWKLTPPGAPGAAPSEAPLDYRLRTEIRQREAEVDRLEKQLRELVVEANLAGVPETWRQ
jgi:hypothetical protein